MEIIQKWFDDGCDYASGVVIYKNLPKHNPTLLKTFQRKQNSFNLEKLKNELKKFGDRNIQISFVTEIKKAVSNAVPVGKSVIESEKKQAVLFHELPEALRPVLLEANQLFKENCLLKVNLNELPEHAEKAALEIQLKINGNIKQNAICWKKIDFFLEHRVIAETPKSEFEGLTPAGLLRAQQLLYASISKLNTRLKNNKEVLKTVEYVHIKSKIERQIFKQEENLLKQNEKLIIISNLIDGK